MTHRSRHTPVLFPGLQRTAVASLLAASLPGHRESFGGCLLISHHAWAMASSHLWSSCWQAHLPFVSELSCALVSAAVLMTWYQGQETAASVPALCLALPNRKADGPFISTWNWHFPAYLWKGTCGPPVGTMQMFTLLPGRGQPAGFQERCSPIPWDVPVWRVS